MHNYDRLEAGIMAWLASLGKGSKKKKYWNFPILVGGWGQGRVIFQY